MTSLLPPWTYLNPSAVHESAAGRTLALETSVDATPAGEVELSGMRMTLMLPSDPAHGFSGEGGVLHDPVKDSVAELLSWEPRIDMGEPARQADLSTERVRAALTMPGASGQIGYDLAEEAYFHRHPPYPAGAAEKRNPYGGPAEEHGGDRPGAGGRGRPGDEAEPSGVSRPLENPARSVSSGLVRSMV